MKIVKRLKRNEIINKSIIQFYGPLKPLMNYRIEFDRTQPWIYTTSYVQMYPSQIVFLFFFFLCISITFHCILEFVSVCHSEFCLPGPNDPLPFSLLFRLGFFRVCIFFVYLMSNLLLKNFFLPISLYLRINTESSCKQVIALEDNQIRKPML